MKALITTAIITVSAFAGVAQADVSTRYKFVAANEATESSVCVVAAENGYIAAKYEAFKAGLEANTVFCNGRTLNRFARKYSKVAKVAEAKAAL